MKLLGSRHENRRTKHQHLPTHQENYFHEIAAEEKHVNNVIALYCLRIHMDLMLVEGSVPG
jgi:hypothetical protein